MRTEVSGIGFQALVGIARNSKAAFKWVFLTSPRTPTTQGRIATLPNIPEVRVAEVGNWWVFFRL